MNKTRAVKKTAEEKIEELRQQIAHLETQLADLYARLPAHSIPPAMLAELDELDELLLQTRQQMAALQEEISGSSSFLLRH